MNYEMSIHTFKLVHGFNSEQRFHETWADDVATTYQMFFSSTSYDHEVLFIKKRKFPR